MSLTTDDLNAVRAQWEEWTADSGFELTIEVKAAEVGAVAILDGKLGVRVEAPLYCQVEIFQVWPHTPSGHPLAQRVFSERIPYDAAALRASVIVLARTIAGWAGGEADGD